MATSEPSPQRVYRSACPNCGAPVEFRSAASAFAVCSFCRSTLLREGDALRRIGQSAELFDDHSPLQLGAAGKYQGAAFTLVGRLQIRYAEGSWNEWHALFDAGGAPKSGWLSEDNGRYVIGFDAPLDGPIGAPSGAPSGAPAGAPMEAASGTVPRIAEMRAGESRRVGGQVWSVASVLRAKLAAAQGELPFAPDLANEFLVADLRNTRGEVGTLEEPVGAAPRWSIGRSVSLTELLMTGLADDGGDKGVAVGKIGARGLSCPNCGAALEPTLATTQSIVCGQCKSVVDISQGAGADLAHYRQDNPNIDGGAPQIPLGSVGTLALGGAAKAWQVVGYVERCELPESADDERVFWREYLLYNRIDGFAFLVDAEDGWSWSRPITGVPQAVGGAMQFGAVTYRPLYSYVGIVTYVLGEFYWRLQRDERTRNTDYSGTGGNTSQRLNREETRNASGNEVVWSAGETLPSQAIAAAFKLPDAARAALQRDAGPLSASASTGASWGIGKALIVFLVIAVIIVLLSRCGRDDCDDVRRTFGAASSEYQQCARSGGGGVFRSGGGAFGGFSSGGSHK